MHILGECYVSLDRTPKPWNPAAVAYSHQAAGNRDRQAVTLRLLASVQARNGLSAQARE